MQFESPLYFILCLPLGILIALQIRAKENLSTVILTGLGIFLAIFGLARPFRGGALEASHKQNLYIAVDTSKSMQVEDVSPSRLTRASLFLNKLIADFPGQVALFPFAEEGTLLAPLTSDKGLIEELLTNLSTDITSQPGTNLNTALTLLFEEIRKRGEQAHVLLVSDGESAPEFDKKSLTPYRDNRIAVFTLGVGTPMGGWVPVDSRMGGKDYLIEGGKRVVSRLEDKPLKTISDATSGQYFTAEMKNIEPLRRALQMPRNPKKALPKKVEWAPVLFALSFLIFFLYWSLQRWEVVLRIMLIPLFFTSSLFAEIEDRTALEAYNLGVEELARNPGGAIDLFYEALSKTTDPEIRKKSQFNLGEAYTLAGDLQLALQTFQKTIDEPWNSRSSKRIDEKASKNLALIKKKMEEMKQQQQQQQQGEGENKAGQDPKEAKKDYPIEQLSQTQRNRIYEWLSEEEREILKRQAQKRSRPGGRPW